MSFSATKIIENDFSLIRLKHSPSQTFADIMPGLGATLHSFSVETGDGPLNVIDNYPNKTTAEKEIGISYKGPKLSPFVCRMAGGKYQWNNQSYQFTNKFMDGSAIHGLLFNKSFSVVEAGSDEDKAFVQLSYLYNNYDPAYPFIFKCDVGYTLHSGNSLEVNTRISNLSPQAIPMADGWHPYFSMGAKISDCELQFNSSSMLEFDEKLIPTGAFIEETGFKNKKLIGDRFLDNCFLLDSAPVNPVCSLRNPDRKIQLNIHAEKNYPYLQIYTPDHRNSIAIENLSGAPNCFNNKMGLKVIEPGQSESFIVRYELLLQ
jgi:aldose 1-epimerase